MGEIWCRGFLRYSQFFVKGDFIIDRVQCTFIMLTEFHSTTPMQIGTLTVLYIYIYIYIYIYMCVCVYIYYAYASLCIICVYMSI